MQVRLFTKGRISTKVVGDTLHAVLRGIIATLPLTDSRRLA